MKNYLPSEPCPCGRSHQAAILETVVRPGAIRELPEWISRLGAQKPFLLADAHTRAAIDAVCGVLDAHQIPYSAHIFEDPHLEPDERAAGSAVMHFDTGCDLIVAIGSGVINDIGKLLSSRLNLGYIIVATAPSMDGYASSTSSMAVDGLKVSLNTRCADVIIGDISLLKDAPLPMLQAGLGDMLAKYVSIAEWRIAHLITGEYYCEAVARLVRDALKRCISRAEGLKAREEEAVSAVFEGLVVTGIAMSYAGVSRPASGVEHYFSHIWDMRGLEFGTPVHLHGIQCAVATLTAVRLYEKLKTFTPDRGLAEAGVRAFDPDAWNRELRDFLGSAAEAMIRLEEKEKKYDLDRHAARFERIASHWDEILRILDEELPSSETILGILETIGLDGSLSSLGVDLPTARRTFKATKDIRDKYVLSRLAWDLGILDPLAEEIC